MALRLVSKQYILTCGVHCRILSCEVITKVNCTRDSGMTCLVSALRCNCFALQLLI